MKRFIKESNGNVLIQDENNVLLVSYSTAVNIMKHPRHSNSLFLTDDTSPQENTKGFEIDFDDVDLGNCEPAIIAADANELRKALQANFFFRKVELLAPYIEDVIPDIVTISQNNIIVEVIGSHFVPATVFRLGSNIVINNVVSLTANAAQLDITTNTVIEDIPVTAVNGSNDSFGSVNLWTRSITVLIPNDNGPDALWSDKVGAITTGTGFCQGTGSSGWNKGATFAGVAVDEDFSLEFNMKSLGSGRSGMGGMNTVNTTVHFDDIDYAWHRPTSGLAKIYEEGSLQGSFGPNPVDDNTFFEIKRFGNTIYWLIDSVEVRSKTEASAPALIADFAISKNLQFDNIKLSVYGI